MDRYLNQNEISSQLFHFDGEDPILLKVFIYLTDVSEKDGPFVYLEKSQNFFNKIQMIFLHGIHGISDLNFSPKLLPKVKKFTGSAGDIIFADTNGYHKGNKLNSESSGRILLNLSFVSKWPTSKPPIDGFITYKSSSKLLSNL